MAYFIVVGLDHPPHSMALREAHRAHHRDHVLTNDADIWLAGAVVDDDGNQAGSVYVFEADNADQVRDWLAQEPFVKEGVYRDLHVLRWTPVLNRLPPADWR